MKLTSPSFAPEGKIPRVHTCQGKDSSPALAFEEVPAGTKSLALIVDDPDAPDPRAPRTVWVHWVLYGLPAGTRALAEDASARGLPAGTRVGTNDFGKVRWSGPCPPIGRHRYVFKLYALDKELPDLGPATKQALERAMAGHVLAEARLVATYQKGD
jgi:Raf kinase inhibitor-like YbhB/YbcL family protein